MSRSSFFRVVLLCALSLSAVTACTLGKNDNDGIVAGDTAEVTVSFKAPAEGTRAVTAGDESERTIHSLDMLVFDSAGNFIERRTATRIANQNGQFKATVQAGNNLRIHFLANCYWLLNNFNSTIFESGGSFTWDDIRAALIDADPHRLTGQPSTGLPMWAYSVKTIEKDKINNLGTVELLRSVASVDVRCKSTIDTDDFTLTSLRLYFAADRGNLTSDPANIISGQTGDLAYMNGNVVAPELPAAMKTLDQKASASDRVLLYDQPAAALSTNAILYKMYMYDNDAPVVSTTGRRATRLIIGGKYKGGNETYYPVDFIDPADGKTYLDIRRNHKYEFQINSVSGAGYTDPGIASESFPVNMQIDLIPWIQVAHPHIHADGPSWITIERKDAYLTRDIGSKDLISISSNIKLEEFEPDFKTNKNGNSYSIIQKNGAQQVTSIMLYNDRFTVNLIGSEAPAGSELEGYFQIEWIEVIAKGVYDEANPERNTDTVVFTTTYSRIQFELNIYQLDSDDNDWRHGGNQGNVIG